MKTIITMALALVATFSAFAADNQIKEYMKMDEKQFAALVDKLSASKVRQLCKSQHDAVLKWMDAVKSQKNALDESQELINAQKSMIESLKKARAHDKVVYNALRDLMFAYCMSYKVPNERMAKALKDEYILYKAKNGGD